MKEIISQHILGILERTPQWIRADLESKDVSARRRAEESLAAMIANSLEAADCTSPEQQT
ncbi:MAG: DUF6771 family protein [Pseudomonadota bacterium]|nr:hypothetical protein [Sphingobium naphthae]MEC7931641.1 DUF6771 family protein [Pseudomonadota bacterium]MEE2742206.1 DUF6771 family protein [Pseudomonadota bacterium]|tara:strand:+ start:2706 stop:2885 length:180 start_codon:yes stop_codon:yes gene_type:complete